MTAQGSHASVRSDASGKQTDSHPAYMDAHKQNRPF
jgi:hypothetical protein